MTLASARVWLFVSVALVGCATLTPAHHRQLAEYEACDGRGRQTLASMMKHGTTFHDAVGALGALALVEQQGRFVRLTNEQAQAISAATRYPEDLPTRAQQAETARCLEQRYGYKIALPK